MKKLPHLLLSSLICFHFNLAALAQNNNTEAALRQAVMSQPGSAEAKLKLAAHLLEQLRKDWSVRDTSLSGTAQIQQSEGFQMRANELIQLYQSIIQLNPKHAEARVDMAEIYFSFQGRYDQTEALLQEALQVNPQSIKANIAWAEYQFFFRGKRDQALDLLRSQLTQQSNNPELSITLADLMTGSTNQSSDFDLARQVLNQALSANPGHRNLRYMLASTWARQAQLVKDADSKNFNQKALDIYVSLLQEEVELSLSLEASQLAQNVGRLDQGRALIQEALKQAPNHPLLTQQLGDLWLQQGAKALDKNSLSPELEAAEKYYLQVQNGGRFMDLNVPQRVQLYYNLGLISRARAISNNDSLADFEKSLAYFKQAQALFDRINLINAPLQQELAKSLMLLGELKAKQNIKSAAELYREACQLKQEKACNWLQEHQLPQ